MRLNRRYVLLFVILLVMLIAPHFLQAAPPDPDCDPLDPNCPIDGGLGILIAAGIGLGAKKIMKKEG